MSDQPENLTLRALRDTRAAVADNTALLREVLTRLSRIEAGQITARREAANDAESVAHAHAHAHARIDELRAQLARVNARLGLLDE